jgi:hypothetical protein
MARRYTVLVLVLGAFGVVLGAFGVVLGAFGVVLGACGVAPSAFPQTARHL